MSAAAAMRLTQTPRRAGPASSQAIPPIGAPPDAGAGGMAPFAAPHATAHVAARSPCGRAAGVSAGRRRRGPKGQRKAAAPRRHGPPRGQPATGGLSVAQRSAPPSCGAFAWAAANSGPARGSAQLMHQEVPQRSTQLRRRAHAVHPRGGAARPETPVSCNSLIPLRSRRPRPTP